ncbi:hypothetical protein AB0M43_14485 [Longispora sp. NPDC051575]|uniref:hypothetical protein n=1 Tax=Longispora sp. NPDC051575 TaxID=3154943 RepID=UPI00343FDD84
MARRHGIDFWTLTSRQRPPTTEPQTTAQDPTVPQEQDSVATQPGIYHRDTDGNVGYTEEVASYGQQADIGMWLVFAGDWQLYQDRHSLDRVRVGYLGQITSLIDGWPAFRTTRLVLEAVVSHHAGRRGALRDHLTRKATCSHKVEAAVDLHFCRLDLHGDVLVWDDRAGSGDPTSRAHIRPDPDGLYDLTLLGWNWMPVHPEACDSVASDVPPPTRA